MESLGAPEEGVLEISVFGKGFGESILIHLPDGKWIIIDTYLENDKTPIALKYLNQIGVCPATSVGAVLFTHWHDDHIKGAAQVVKACSTAKVALTGYLQSAEFETLMNHCDAPDGGSFGTGVDELEKILEILTERTRERLWCYSNTVILEDYSNNNYQLEALSPSHSSFENLIRRIRNKNEVDNRISSVSPNNSSVATVLRVNNDLLIFGADLEIGQSTHGWENVHKHVWNNRGKASLLKIAHHGSIGAAHEKIWNDCVEPDVFAALTPWNRGRKLPQSDGVNWIQARTSNAYAAAKPNTSRLRVGVAITDKIIKDSGVKLLKENSPGGHVRFRKKDAGPWKVDLFGNACTLKDLLI